MSTLRARIKRIASNLGLRPLVAQFQSLRFKIKSKDFKSANYWESRYRAKGTSGSGSYGRLALYKANFLNAFVQEHGIQTVVELGCGDGNQLSLAEYPNYKGFDVSPTVIGICQKKFGNDPSKTFAHTSELDRLEVKAQLSLSLDVLYHLVEDHVFETYLRQLFEISEKFVIVYSSNFELYGATSAAHVRHRVFTSWIEENLGSAWKLIRHEPNPYPWNEDDPDNSSLADFFIFEKVQQNIGL